MTTGPPYDAVIVGGGHNGLVAAAYLARAGWRTLVLERRDQVGGMCEPVEYFPGHVASITNSPGSLEPRIIQDLELARHGLEFIAVDPTLVFALPGGDALLGWRDPGRAAEEIRRYSRRDAERYQEFFRYLDECAALLDASVFAAPPPFADLVAGIKDGRSEQMFAETFFGSIQDLLDDWFESEQVKALIGSMSVVNSLTGPRTPGTVLRMLLRPLSLRSSARAGHDDPRRVLLRGSTGVPRGGMGAITRAMAASVRAAGGEIQTGSGVGRITVEQGRVSGVALADGREIRARTVLSNLNPKTTFLDLVGPDALGEDFVGQVRKLRMRGSAFKIGLALSGIPRFSIARSETEARLLASCQFRIAPSLDYLERAYDDAKYGRPSREPILMGLTPSVVDPSLAPAGRHVMSVNVFHAPYHLSGASWDEERERFGKRCIAALSEYIPNLPDIITDTRFWSPEDLERDYGLVEGNITHGEMLPRSMFSFRPVPGWSDYRTPVPGLYLCGSGTWPGGFVSGVPGHNASHQVLADAHARRAG